MQADAILKPEQKTLLKFCICGSEKTERDIIHKIQVLICKDCGIMRQDLPGYTQEMYFNYYSTDYHTAEQEKIGCVAYKERYSHDKQIAKIRCAEYEKTIDIRFRNRILDIGSSNNAFVDYMNENGYCANGIEIGEEGKKHKETTYTRDLLELNLEADSFDLITLHDVFEHLIDPNEYLKEIKRILKSGGKLVLDLPHYFVPEGVHHWRPVQHLWFFDENQTKKILSDAGFGIVAVKTPIPSKIVFYCIIIK
jgi:SAM-dependent methyltransferase